MSLRSMTGFGKARTLFRGMRIEVELGSVNRKQFDAKVILPRNMLAMESRVSKLIAEHVSRGQVGGSVKMASAGGPDQSGHVLDLARARLYVCGIRRVATKLGLKDDLTARSLIGLREWLQFEEPGWDAEQLWPGVRVAVEMATAKLVAMRDREGRALQKDMQNQLKLLRRLLARIQARAPAVQKHYRNQLLIRLRDAGLANLNVSDPAVSKELALFADRSDITEETVRLASHFEQVAGYLGNQRQRTVGRELDFLCQEMFREINTIGNKANDSAISRVVVEFKAVLERFREQVQNVE